VKVALVGPPKSGKSSLFSAVTGAPMDPYAPPEIVHAVIKVPEPRLAYLVGLYKPKKTTEATIEFVDVPGAALDDAKGRDAWRRLLPEVRQAEAIVVVVREFANASVPAYRDRVDPKSDFDATWDELMFSDLESVTTRIDRVEKALKKPTKMHEQEKRELALLTRCRDALESGKPLSAVLTNEDEKKLVASFAFLSEKPLVCVRNVDDDRAGSTEPLAVEHAVASLVLSASIEAEIAVLEPGDRQTFLEELGLREPARDRLIRSCYTACGLISFLTMGADEVRAWTIRKGATAVEAAGKIHTDLAQSFVRAETVSYDDLLAHRDLRGARAAGKVRKEGRAYVVADGDILNILATA